MENLILQKRKMVQDRIQKSFEPEIEKAYSVGQSHPKHPDWLWTDLGNGKFDWKSKNGKWWKGKTGNVATPAPASKPAAQKKFDADVIEHVDELVKKIGKDKALERFERYVKEYGDDGTKFGAMMKYKYSQAAEYLKGKAESDFKKTFKDARDEVLQQVVSGKIQASADEKKWAKDLLDERKAAEDAANSKNASDEIFDKLSEAFWNKKTKLEDFKSMVDKFLGSGSFDSIWKEVNSRQHSSSKETDNDFLSTLQNRIHASSANVDSKQDKAAQNAGFKDYKEMKAWQDYGTAKQLLKKELKRRGKPDKQKIADLKEEIATYEKNHADVIAAHDGGKKAVDNHASSSSKIDDTTIDQDVYDKEKSSYIWAGTASVEKDLKTITDDIEASKKSLIKHLNDKNFADLQKDFTEKISRKKALEDILEARKDVEKKKTIGEKIIKKFDDLKGGTWNTPLSDRCNIKVDGDGTMYIRGNNTHYGAKKIIAEIKFKGDEYTFKWGSFADNPRIKKYHSKDDIKNAVESILSSENFKMVKKFKDDGNSFFNELAERVKSATFSGKLSDDARKKLENAIKNDKASINDLLKIKFPSATATPGFNTTGRDEVQLANGKILKLVHEASIYTDRIGQEYTKHRYEIKDEWGKLLGSYGSTRGYTTPSEAKQSAINQALYAIFCR